MSANTTRVVLDPHLWASGPDTPREARGTAFRAGSGNASTYGRFHDPADAPVIRERHLDYLAEGLLAVVARLRRHQLGLDPITTKENPA